MTNINRVLEVGRITRDLGEKDFGYLPTGTARANISIAVNRATKKNNEWVDEVSYFDIVIWGKTAENLQPYLKKGQLVGIDGYLKQERWQDKDTYQQRSKIVIVAEQVELLGGKAEKTEQQNNNYNPMPNNNNYGQTQNMQPQKQYKPVAQQPSNFYDQSFPEDIPF